MARSGKPDTVRQASTKAVHARLAQNVKKITFLSLKTAICSLCEQTLLGLKVSCAFDRNSLTLNMFFRQTNQSLVNFVQFTKNVLVNHPKTRHEKALPNARVWHASISSVWLCFALRKKSSFSLEKPANHGLASCRSIRSEASCFANKCRIIRSAWVSNAFSYAIISGNNIAAS